MKCFQSGHDICRKSLVTPQKALDLSLYASQDELQAFCQIWGLNGVRELANATQAPLADAVGIIDAAVKMHEPLLQSLKAEYLVRALSWPVSTLL